MDHHLNQTSKGVRPPQREEGWSGAAFARQLETGGEDEGCNASFEEPPGGGGSQKSDTMPKTPSLGTSKKGRVWGGGVKAILRCEGEPPIFSTNGALPGFSKNRRCILVMAATSLTPYRKVKLYTGFFFSLQHTTPPSASKKPLKHLPWSI